MPVTPQELLDSALRFDSAKTENESDYRACVSRAYYAAFHSANNFHKALPKLGIPLNGCGLHKSLVNQLLHPNISDKSPEYEKSLEAGHYIKKMLFNRTQSDYEIDQSVYIKSVKMAFTDADLVFNSVK